MIERMNRKCGYFVPQGSFRTTVPNKFVSNARARPRDGIPRTHAPHALIPPPSINAAAVAVAVHPHGRVQGMAEALTGESQRRTAAAESTEPAYSPLTTRRTALASLGAGAGSGHSHMRPCAGPPCIARQPCKCLSTARPCARCQPHSAAISGGGSSAASASRFLGSGSGEEAGLEPHQRRP